jgi:hypothetical protein
MGKGASWKLKKWERGKLDMDLLLHSDRASGGEFGPWGMFVLISAALAGFAFLAIRSLRTHGIAVVISAGVWFLNRLVLVPWTLALGGEVDGLGLAIGLDCGSMMFILFHCLVFLALLIQMVRLAVKRKPPGKTRR